MTAIKNGTLLVKDSNGNTARVATLSQTDITTLNTALTDIGTNSVSIQSLTDQVKTIQGRYVDVDTAQTITGLKCFEKEFCAVQLRDPTIDVNVLPAQGKEFGHYLYFLDKNNKILGIIKAVLTDTGATQIGMFTTPPAAQKMGLLPAFMSGLNQMVPVKLKQ